MFCVITNAFCKVKAERNALLSGRSDKIRTPFEECLKRPSKQQNNYNGYPRFWQSQNAACLSAARGTADGAKWIPFCPVHQSHVAACGRTSRPHVARALWWSRRQKRPAGAFLPCLPLVPKVRDLRGRRCFLQSKSRAKRSALWSE